MKNIIFLILILILIGCNTKETLIEVEEKIAYFDSPINDFLSSIRTPPQKFIINSNQDTILKSKNGTLIYIPKEIFINQSGKTHLGQIDIKLIEALKVSDFLLNNLQTTSNGEILASGGMVFIDATTDNKPLEIQKDKSISIELKTKYKDVNMKLFAGDFEENELNWIPVNGMNSSPLISIPFEFLNFNYCAWECGYGEEEINSLKQKKYDNTYITTREFEQRMCYLAYFSCDHQEPIGSEILNIYKENSAQNLSYSDSLVINYLEENLSGLIDTNYIKDEFKFDDKGWVTSIYLGFLDFTNQYYTKPLQLKKYNINFPVSREELENLNITSKEINKILSYQNIRKRVIENLKDKSNTNKLASYSFSINKLGWINVDKFLNDPKCKKTDFYVEVNNIDTINSISVSLVIPNRNISLFSIFSKDNQYSFTKKENGYRMLPIEEDAYIVAIGVKNNQSYFGMKQIKIPKTGSINLKIDQLDKELIKDAITNISKK